MYQQNALAGKYSPPTFRGLAAAGFPDLLPIIPPGAQLSPQSTVKPGDCGKVPGDLGPNGWRSIPGWRGQAVASPAHHQEWDLNELARGAGIGLRAAEFPGVDIDVSDATLADQLTQLTLLHLGPSPRRIGRAPRRLHPYRLKPGPAVGKRVLEFTLAGVTHKVEVLGAGQQYVLHGTHPGTGQPYAWPDGDLVSLGASALPEVGEAELDAYLAAAEALVLRHGAVLTSTSAHGALADDYPDQDGLRAPGAGLARCTLVREALRSIPNGPASGRSYDEWFRVLCAVRGSLGPHLADDPAVVAEVVAWSDQWAPDPQGHEDKYRNAAPAPHKVGWDDLRAIATAAGWSARYETELRLADAVARFRADPLPTAANDNPASGPWICPADFAGRQAPARRWLVPGWIPMGHVTALFGPGGVGKSLLALQLATAVGSGRDFLGLPVAEPGPVLTIFGEDDEQELERRQADVNAVTGTAPLELLNVRHLPAAGLDNALVRVSREGVLTPTALYQELAQRVAAIGAKLVVIDNIAQCFPGNENARAEVTAFANLLTRLAREHDCAVLLLGHPSKADGSTFSGSTAWDAAVRQRLYFGRPEGADKDEASRLAMRDLRVLQNLKSNYSRAGNEVHVAWSRGAFVVQGGVGDLSPVAAAEAIAQQRRDDEAFLDGMNEVRAMGKHLADTRQAHDAYYVTRLMALSQSVRQAGMTGKRVEAAARRLLMGGHIVVGDAGKGPDRKPRRGYVRTDKPLPPVANLPPDMASLPLFEGGDDCGDLRQLSEKLNENNVRPLCGDLRQLPEKPNENNAATCGRTLPYTYGIEAGPPVGAAPASVEPWADAQAVEAKPGATMADVEAMLRSRSHG